MIDSDVRSVFGFVRASQRIQVQGDSFMRQTDSIIKYCQDNNLVLDCIYFDVCSRDAVGTSGAFLTRIIKDNDILVCESTDRIGMLKKVLHNTDVVIEYTSEIINEKRAIIQADSTVEEKAVSLDMLATREMRDRIKAGIQRAREKGVKMGRPHSDFDRKMALTLKEEGWSYREMGRALGVSHATLFRYFKTAGVVDAKEQVDA